MDGAEKFPPDIVALGVFNHLSFSEDQSKCKQMSDFWISTRYLYIHNSIVCSGYTYKSPPLGKFWWILQGITVSYENFSGNYITYFELHYNFVNCMHCSLHATCLFNYILGILFGIRNLFIYSKNFVVKILSNHSM